jgi:hypothetical protein
MRTAVVAAVALALVGCATGGHRGMAEVRAGVGGNENKACSWTFGKGADGRLNPETLAIANKPGGKCERDDLGRTNADPGKKLYIGERPSRLSEIISSGPGEFETKGSPCRYCYTNTWGGITCIRWDGPC